MGFDVKKFAAILTAVAPGILLVVPGGAALTPLVPLILAGIGDAQKQPGATGPEKKAYVLQLVADAATGTNVVKPGTIDPTLVVAAAGHAIDAILTSVKAVETAHAQFPDLPGLVPAA